MSSLHIEQFEIGPLGNFLYLISDKDTKELAIMDPAWDPEFLMNKAESMGCTITSVFLTHGHPDHVNGLGAVLDKHDVPVYISKHEADFLTPDTPNLVKLDDGDEVKLGNSTFKTLLAPGHTPGCQCFIHDNIAFVGDVLFIDGCGRCDLKGGDPTQMYYSLYEKMMKLPDETIIYPGHNYGPKLTDTMGNQKKTNPYLTCSSLEEFLSTRM